MTHVLIVKDKHGKELARVPVQSGYTTCEVALTKVRAASETDHHVDAKDGGAGTEKVG